MSDSYDKRMQTEAEAKRIQAMSEYAEAEAKRLTAAMEAESVVRSETNDDLLKRDHEFRMAQLPHQTTKFWVAALAVVACWMIGAIAWATAT